MSPRYRDCHSQRFVPARQGSRWSGAQPRSAAIAARIVLLLLGLIWPRAAALCQSQPSSAQSQSSQQSQAQQQSQSQQKEESVADAARKAKARKAKPESGKVYTEEDLSGMRGSGVSVVGHDNPAATAGVKNADGKATVNAAPMSGQDEAYWRRKARELLDKIAAVDQEIAKLKDDIKKYGNGGFDITTGMKNNVAYIEDRNGQVEELQKRKADLEKKLDLLQEEGRKAGASPAWFR